MYRVPYPRISSSAALAMARSNADSVSSGADPPYGVELDMEWRDRAGLNRRGPAEASYMKHRIEGHTTTTISGDTIADWSPAFALVPSLAIAYVWHATSHTIEVAQGLKSIGFELRQQIIWGKTVAAISRQPYHWKHARCCY